MAQDVFKEIIKSTQTNEIQMSAFLLNQIKEHLVCVEQIQMKNFVEFDHEATELTNRRTI